MQSFKTQDLYEINKFWLILQNGDQIFMWIDFLLLNKAQTIVKETMNISPQNTVLMVDSNPLLSAPKRRGSDEPNTAISQCDLQSSNIIPFNQNFTKQQIIKHKSSIFLNNSNPRSQGSRFLIEFLQEKNLTFTGTDLRYYEIKEEELLVAASCSGIRLPTKSHIYELNEVGSFAGSFPLVIKPDWELDCIRGKQENFLVGNMEELTVMAETMIEESGGAFLEEFIPGRQVVCLAYSSGNTIKSLSPVEFNFIAGGPKIITNALKSDPMRKQWYELLTDADLSVEIKKKVEFLFKLLNLTGEFFFTLRINKEEMFLINFKPVFLPLQSGARPFKTSGLLQSILFHNNITKKDMLNLMIDVAVSRQQARRSKYSIKYSQKKGIPILVANSQIAMGQIIYEQDNASENIIIVDWVKNYYNKIQWGDLWNRNSSAWRPVSHSCSPNAVARQNEVKAVRNIAKGEEISIDLATLFYHDLKLQCQCDSDKCRKIIKFKDHHEEWFKEIPSAYMHPWMIDFLFKEAMINLVNAANKEIRLQYQPGNCFAVAKRDLQPGEMVLELQNLPIFPYNTRHSITKSETEYWETVSSTGQYINHKCFNYNIRIKQDDSCMMAVVHIPKDTPLSFNYIMTQWDICFPFACLCGEPNCFRTIKGFKDMTKQQQKQIYQSGHCSTYVKSKYLYLKDHQ